MFFFLNCLDGDICYILSHHRGDQCLL